MNGLIVAFLIGALAGVTAWLILGEARHDMDSFVRTPIGTIGFEVEAVS